MWRPPAEVKMIRVESGSIVLYVEIMQPIQFMQHETRSESGRAPFIDVVINVSGFTGELAARCEEMTIVLEIVHAYFKSIAG